MSTIDHPARPTRPTNSYEVGQAQPFDNKDKTDLTDPKPDGGSQRKKLLSGLIESNCSPHLGEGLRG